MRCEVIPEARENAGESGGAKAEARTEPGAHAGKPQGLARFPEGSPPACVSRANVGVLAFRSADAPLDDLRTPRFSSSLAKLSRAIAERKWE